MGISLELIFEESGGWQNKIGVSYMTCLTQTNQMIMIANLPELASNPN